ncbi:DedA family protein [Campylobacter devanensis]|uniref:Membrane protein, DedA family, type II (SNARE domain) n=1 Tax=Campylobacter devanensis TaxID=3161138 RepID=A0A1X9SSB1_9BACT|nr:MULTISPECIES: DedA family protein [Campylobacter]ARQ99149.1 putative membrane protein, DedA family, type II (SNARE domain) [Campylobacter lanienae]SUX02331.1 DedA family protein [Campylobacter lanienae]
MLENIINYLVSLVADWGYLGIFLLMALESSFFPFPSEVVMIPAGYLVYTGQMNLYLAFGAGALGSLAGAIFNYYLCYFFGRAFILKYGKYIGITDEKMTKFEKFFNKYGEISTFNCRLIPGIRQYISLPAGLAKMNIFTFSLYTTLGAGIWVAILIAIGYYIGDQKELIKEYLAQITICLLIAVAIITIIYLYIQKRFKK